MAKKSTAKPKLLVMPARTWTSSEEVVKAAESILENAKSGQIRSLAYVAERADGLYESGSTKVENKFAIFGYLLSLGLRVSGFEDKADRKPI